MLTSCPGLGHRLLQGVGKKIRIERVKVLGGKIVSVTQMEQRIQPPEESTIDYSTCNLFGPLIVRFPERSPLVPSLQHEKYYLSRDACG